MSEVLSEQCCFCTMTDNFLTLNEYTKKVNFEGVFMLILIHLTFLTNFCETLYTTNCVVAKTFFSNMNKIRNDDTRSVLEIKYRS